MLEYSGISVFAGNVRTPVFLIHSFVVVGSSIPSRNAIFEIGLRVFLAASSCFSSFSFSTSFIWTALTTYHYRFLPPLSAFGVSC